MAKLQLKEETATQRGVFADMNEAIAAAKKAQKVIHRMSMDHRQPHQPELSFLCIYY